MSISYAVRNIVLAITLGFYSPLIYAQISGHGVGETIGHKILIQDDQKIPEVYGKVLLPGRDTKGLTFGIEGKPSTQQVALAKARLDKILEIAARKIKLRSTYTEEEAIVILTQISEIITEAGVQLDDNEFPICVKLATGKAACDALSIVYASVGDSLGLPIEIVAYRRHLAIKWIFPDKTYINWETRADNPKGKPASLTDAEFQKWKLVHPTSLESGVYGNPLTDQEILGHGFGPIMGGLANSLIKNDQTELLVNLMSFYERIVKESNRKNLTAMGSLAVVHYQLGEFDRAKSLLEESLQKDPNNALAQTYMGNIYVFEGNKSAAIASFQRVIEIDPTSEMNKLHEENIRILKSAP